MLPSPSLPLVCPIEDIVCRINGNEIAECNVASESFTRSVTEGVNVVEVVISNVVGDSVPSTASISELEKQSQLLCGNCEYTWEH